MEATPRAALALTLLAAGAAVGACRLAGSSAPSGAPRWFRGNTHVHTTRCDHADTSPEEVARWYHDRGYHFLVLSEHNVFIDPAEVALPADAREDFLLVPGEEVTGPRAVHLTAFDIEGLVGWRSDAATTAGVVQELAANVRARGGTPILNHPNFEWAVALADLLPVEGLYHFELYNGHPSVRNAGDAEHPSTEALWDALLDAGRRVYGVSSDDAHAFAQRDPARSNPGRGWVMVRARELTVPALHAALDAGDFYASSGVLLADWTVERRGDRWRLHVQVDEAATRRELESEWLLGERDTGLDPGWRVEWISTGSVATSSMPLENSLPPETGFAATWVPEAGTPWVRAKVTVTIPARDGAGTESFHAWTQPVFAD